MNGDKLTHSSTGEEGGPSAHGVDVTLERHKQGQTVNKTENKTGSAVCAQVPII